MAPASLRRRVAGRAMGADPAFAMRSSSPSARRHPRVGQCQGFTFRLQRPRGATAMPHCSMHATSCWAWPRRAGADAGAARRLEDAPSNCNRHRPRQGQRPGRHLRCDQLGAVHRAGLQLRQRLSEPGRLQRVVVQADAPARMQPDDCSKPTPATARASLCRCRLCLHPLDQGRQQTVRYNGYPAMRISAAPRPVTAPVAAMAEMEKLAGQPPRVWLFRTDRPVARRKAGRPQSLILYSFAILAGSSAWRPFVPSWSIPLAVILGATRACWRAAGHAHARLCQRRLFPGGPDHDHRLVGKERHPDHRICERPAGTGQGLIESALGSRASAAPSHHHDLDGVRPRVAAWSSPAAPVPASQRAIGTVLGGMVTGTVLAVFVPVFFVVVRSLFKGSGATPAGDEPPPRRRSRSWKP